MNRFIDSEPKGEVGTKIYYVPLDLIFASPEKPDSLEDPRGTASIRPESGVVPLVALKPQMDLIRYIVSGKGDPDSYWQWLAAERPGKTVDREKYLKAFRRKFRLFRFGLLRERPTIIGLHRDRLILGDGKEVACLAKYLGNTWIKVQMTPEVYQQWQDRPTSQLETVLSRTGRKTFYHPIYHEKFRKVKVSRPDSVRLDRIRRVLGPLEEGLHGLDIGCNIGYMSHHLQRQGFEMTGVDFNEDHLAVARALNETYRLNTLFIKSSFKDFNPGQVYDLVVALTVLYHLFFIQKEIEPATIAAKVGAMTGSVLFWESGDQPEKEKDLILLHSGLTEFYSLGETEGTGLRRELGFFLRPHTELSSLIAARFRSQFEVE